MEEEPLPDTNSRTPLIILGVAALVLVIVATISFSKYMAAQKDPGNQVQVDALPQTPEQRAEYERQQIRDQLLESGGVVADPQTAIDTAQPTETAKTAKVGHVVSFSTEWNFVTIDVGSNQNIKKGDIFSVASDDIIKGAVKVDQVFPDQSIAILVTENNLQQFLAPKQGDEIRVLKVQEE